MTLCAGIRDGWPCSQEAAPVRSYCTRCDPDVSALSFGNRAPLIKQQELARRIEAEERDKKAKQRSEQEAKIEQRKEIVAQEIQDAILEVRDLESLRRLELKIMEGLVSGAIDSKAGSPLSQMLKHQAELLRITVLKDENALHPHEREAAVQIAITMSPEKMLNLLADFSGGMASLRKQARGTEPPTITVSANEVSQ
jgi:hypothetical protein